MYLQIVHVKNYRCLRDITVSFSPGLNVIAGENNTGKTALLDAIRAALGPAAATGEAIRLTQDDRHRTKEGTYIDAPISVKLIFADLTEQEQGQFIDILNYNPTEPSESTAQINFQWNWNAKTGRYSINRWGGSAGSSESGIPEDVLQSVPVTLLGALRDAASALLPGRNSRLAHLLIAHATEEEKSRSLNSSSQLTTHWRKTNLFREPKS